MKDSNNSAAVSGAGCGLTGVLLNENLHLKKCIFILRQILTMILIL